MRMLRTWEGQKRTQGYTGREGQDGESIPGLWTQAQPLLSAHEQTGERCNLLAGQSGILKMSRLERRGRNRVEAA